MRTGILALALCSSLVANVAAARSQQDLRYSFEVIWNSAVRLVRVELGLPIDEKDEEAGFFIFAYTDHGEPYPGSVELVRRRDPRAPVSVVVHIGGMPSYVERMILGKLERKLEREYGRPKDPEPPAKPAPPAEEPPASEQPPAEEEPTSSPPA